jgi:hypothetical protein
MNSCQYYRVNNGHIKYHYKFPYEWAIDHHKETGPEKCLECAVYGSIKDIFIGYCAKCALEYPNRSRGLGIYKYGEEMTHKISSSEKGILYSLAPTYQWIRFTQEEMCNSIYNTYLQNTTRGDLCEEMEDTTRWREITIIPKIDYETKEVEYVYQETLSSSSSSSEQMRRLIIRYNTNPILERNDRVINDWVEETNDEPFIKYENRK